MRNRFNGPRRGRRLGRSGVAPTDGSPYDFGSADDEGVEPIDMMAIRADEELLDALASGGNPFGAFGQAGAHSAPYDDDDRMLALLAAWRDEVRDEPVGELLTVSQASEAIVAGQRASRPQRRLMPVAAAAAAVVLGVSGVAIGAGTAQPGDALWGVSKTLNGERAASMEAAQRVSVALASVQQALDEGRVAEAQATLAAVNADLSKVTDEETKKELVTKQSNLVVTAEDAEEGEKVHTDESGKRDDGGSDGDKDKDKDRSDKDKQKSSSNNVPDPRLLSPLSSASSPSSSADPLDPRRAIVPTSPKPTPTTTQAPPPTTTKHPPPSTDTTRPPTSKPETSKAEPPKDDSHKTEESKSDSSKTESEPKNEGKGESESDKSSSSGGTALPAQPPPPAQQQPTGP